jgi:hypothetical protein
MAIPSIALVPSGYKSGTLFSELPTNGNADLDVVRNSTANRINKDGLIEEMGLNVPLLDYSDSTCPSLLLQPQSRNEITTLYHLETVIGQRVVLVLKEMRVQRELIY